MDEIDYRFKHLWNNFLLAGSNSSEGKRWFDLFLGHFLVEFQNKISHENVLPDVPDVIAKEFIFEIHSACTELAEGDELAPLRKYLLQNRGWRCLAVLFLFRNLKLSRTVELANLLISLYAVIEYEDCLNCERKNAYLLETERKCIDDIVQEKVDAIKKNAENLQERINRRKDNKLKKYDRNSKIGDLRQKRCQSADSDLMNQDYPKLLLNGKRLSPQSASASTKSNVDDIISSTDSVFNARAEETSKIENYDTEAVQQVLNDKINPLECRLLILSLLQELCRCEQLSREECEKLIDSVIKFALENVCVLQYRYHHSQQHASSIEEIRSQLVHLLIICGNEAKKCRRLADSLCQNGIVQIFVQLLQEVSNSMKKCDDETTSTRDLNFLYSLLYSILNLFSQMLIQENATKNLGSFNKLYRQFIGCTSGRLVENIIKTFFSAPSNVDRSLFVKRLKIIVTFFGLLIVRFKKLRRKVNRLEDCRIGYKDPKELFSRELPSHHDALFGKAYQPLMLSPNALQENCCITSTFVVLLKIAIEGVEEELTICILRVLQYCGCCCCVPAHWFLPKILKLVCHKNLQLRHQVVSFLERRFYADIGMFKCTDCPRCSIVEGRTIDLKCRKYLDEYKMLLLHEDSEIVRLVGAHLFKVFVNFNYDVQRFLLTQMLSSLFMTALTEYRKEDQRYKDVILICLSIISDSSINRAFSAELDMLLQTKEIQNLLRDSNFTELCCRILETRIKCKMSKLENGGSTFTPVLIESCTSELNVLVNCFCDYFDEFVKPFETNENFDVEKGKIMICNLKSMVATLERLILRSSVMKSYFCVNETKNKFQKLLFVVLRILPGGSDIGDGYVYEILLKLLQPLLIVCLSVFDDKNAIEAGVKELLNAALQAGKITLKQVCDSLLSVDRIESVRQEEEAWSATEPFFEENVGDDTGYDADDEVISWSNVNMAFSETSEEDGNRLVSLLESCSKSLLLYPTVCSIAIDLINSLRVDQCTEETMYCLHHITTICKRNPEICEELAKQNVITKLLDKLEESLGEELLTPEETDVQYAITQLLSILFYHRAERSELIRFFDFFKLKQAPFDHLTNALVSVVNKTCEEIVPSSYLHFPVRPVELSFDSDDPAEALLLSMREIQRRNSIASPWVVCGLALPLNTNLDWCIWSTGFATSFWLKFDCDYETTRVTTDEDLSFSDDANDDLVHVISIGYDTLFLETWIDEKTSCFVVRLARPEGSTFEILSQASFLMPLNDGKWHHVVLNVKDTMRQQKVALEISLNIDGLHEETRYLLFIGIFMRKVRPACIMMGDTRQSLKCSYNLGNFMMFRAAILNSERCLTLRAYGPDLENVLTHSANALKPNYASVTWSPNVIREFCLRTVQQRHDENMKCMRDNILITFAPRENSHFHQYFQNNAGNVVSVSMFPPATPALFRKKLQLGDVLNSQAARVVTLCVVSRQTRNTFYARIHELGGFQFLAFLFAKLIDCCQSESIQCDALRLLLRSCYVDPRLYAQFVSYDGFSLISKVITSSRFKISRLAYAELTDVMCNRRAYFSDCEKFGGKNDVYICNPAIVTALLLPHWRQWEKCDSNLMTTLFRGLQSLVSATNAYSSLNFEQLISVNVVERTLDMCKEKFAFEEKCANIDGDLCAAILEFVKTMIGTPPSADHIKSIIDYLYVVHPTSLSFCSDSTKSYYFVFSSFSQHKLKKYTRTDSFSDKSPEEDEIAQFIPVLGAGDNYESKLNKNVPYSRSLSKSMAELQEKRKLLHKYLSSSTSHLTKSDDEEFRDTKTADSGIAGSINADEATETFSYNSLSMLKDGRESDDNSISLTNTQSNGFYKYAAYPDSNENNLFAKELEGAFKHNCNQYIISNGLLNLIHDTILVLPDTSVASVFKKLLDYKLFLILANHPNASVRNTVVKTVLAWLIRCDEEETVRFVVHMKGFYHLANQLSIYPASEELISNCISLMARRHWDILDQVNETEDVTLPSLHFSALPPLLATFPGTIHNFNLALNMVRFFKLLINKVSQALKKLIENGLVESLVKTVLLLIHSDGSKENIQENSILLNEIIDLFALIMSSCIQSPGPLYMRMLNDIVYKCRYLEVTEEALCGMEEDCVQIIHNLHCSVLQAGLDTVLSLIEMNHSQDMMKGRRSPSFLTSMTGSMSASLSSIPSSIMSFTSPNSKQKHLAKSELIDRYKLIISRATEYLEFSSSSVITDKDMQFAAHLFSTLINGVSNIVQNKSYIRFGSPWSSVFWSARDVLRLQASNLLIWMLTPLRPAYLRMSAIDTLMNEPKIKDIISTLVSVSVETEQRFTIFLWHLMYSKVCVLSEAELEMCEMFKNYLIEWNIVSPHAISEVHDRWQFEVSSAMRELSMLYWDLEKSQQDSVYKSVYKMENLSKKVSDIAVSISAAVTERQGKERKKLLYELRNKYREQVRARNMWRKIVQQMSHEQAAWFDPEIYPTCWELDPTEGPARVRKRLRRCYLTINKKFFKKECADKINDSPRYPLSYLFENNDSQSFCTMTLDSLSMDDTISLMCYVINVQPGYEVDGEILIGAKYLYFIASHILNEKVTAAEADKFSFIVVFRDIREIHNRRFNLKECAIELFLTNGKTYFLAFSSQMERDHFISALSECTFANRSVNDLLLSSAVEKWRERHISNWEYLTTLNKIAGRSYNDLMQYPVMPFILADYRNDNIDLREEILYRNLKKPMALQDKKKEIHFINHYNYLKNDTSNSQNTNAVKQQPYHYASHYSNSGTVLHFLLRLPPFTQVFLQYQDNNFDLPDRTFHSLDTTWRLISSESTTDVKELVPEFFYLPEFLLNFENFNFGVRQNGEVVDNVKLPAWANGDARLFILVHRQMLESEYVRENLPHWIDLIFGFKQTGKAAINAINVFHPATYYGFDVSNIVDPVERAAWETMVKTYGQTPRQLFRSPHPMVIQNLAPEDTKNISVIKGVKGLKWGNYIGSPSKAPPAIVWSNQYSCTVVSLVPLITNDVFGLPMHTSLLLSYSRESSVNLVNEGFSLMGAALLSWNYLDGIVRIKERKEHPPIPAIFCPPSDPVTICSTAPDCPFIWIGLLSGNILVFRYGFNIENGGVDICPEPVTLVGHKNKVTSIYLSVSFGIAVSVSEDERTIIWDLNELVYIRSIFNPNLSLNIVRVSETLGDIATVGYNKSDYSSELRLHTINATLIGSVNLKERITSLCFSTAPEGVSVNVIATGLQDGIIRLWSSWDLSPVTDICSDLISRPIISLTFSCDSQHLYASVDDGSVFIWETSNVNGTLKTPKFLNLTSIN